MMTVNTVRSKQTNVLSNVIFLLCHSTSSFVSDKQRPKILDSLSANEVLVWDTFEMSNLCNSLATILGISDISKRIELCRTVNYIQYQKLKVADSSITNCGIVRKETEYGDECDY